MSSIHPSSAILDDEDGDMKVMIDMMDIYVIYTIMHIAPYLMIVMKNVMFIDAYLIVPSLHI